MPRSSKRQTRLTFDPLPLSSPVPAGLSPSVRDRAATVRYDGASPSKRRKVRDAPGTSSVGTTFASEAPTNNLLPTPTLTAPENSFGASMVSDDGTSRLSKSKKQKKKNKQQQKLDLTPSSPQAINSSRPVKAGFFGTQPQSTAADSSNESDASLPDLRPSKKHKKSKKRKHRKSPSPEEAIQVQQPAATTASDDESEEEQMPTTPAASRKRKRAAASSSSPLPAHDDDDDDDSDVVVTGSRKRTTPARKQASVSESEVEANLSDEPPSSTTRKRLRRGRTQTAQAMSTITEEEKQDLEDDMLDLASSGSDTEVRLRQRKKSSQKDARQLALEQLKRRRGGPGPIVLEEDDEEEEDKEDADADSSDLQDEEEDYEDPDDESEDDDLPEPSTTRTTRKQMFAEDEDDEGFVVDDDDGPLGAPSGEPSGIPIAFTRYASMKARDLFRFAIDWMVQKKINPAFQVNDEIYTLTFQKLDDEVKGLAGSKFQSAAWTSDFTLALQARPEMLFNKIDRGSSEHFLRDKCDACNRSGHPATYELHFEGVPYDKNTLEPVAPLRDADEDSDTSSDSSSSSDSNINEAAPVNHDARGRKILPQETVFYLGKFCMRNAETAHSLQHWKWHLFEWVVEYLESAGWSSPEMIVKRDKWSIRKRRKHADTIVDTMEDEGKIKALYQDFKREVDTARNSKQGRWDASP